MIKLNELKHYVIKSLGGHTNNEYEALMDVLDSCKLTIDETIDMVDKIEGEASKLRDELTSSKNWIDSMTDDNEMLMNENEALKAIIDDGIYTPELNEIKKEMRQK